MVRVSIFGGSAGPSVMASLKTLPSSGAGGVDRQNVQNGCGHIDVATRRFAVVTPPKIRPGGDERVVQIEFAQGGVRAFARRRGSNRT